MVGEDGRPFPGAVLPYGKANGSSRPGCEVLRGGAFEEVAEGLLVAPARGMCVCPLPDQ